MRHCKQLETVNFGPNVKSIGESAFGYCEALTAVDLPDGIETIGQSAFASCKSLERITLPQTLKLISGDVFTNCAQIASITIPASVDSIGCTFNGCKAKSGSSHLRRAALCVISMELRSIGTSCAYFHQKSSRNSPRT